MSMEMFLLFLFYGTVGKVLVWENLAGSTPGPGILFMGRLNCSHCQLQVYINHLHLLALILADHIPLEEGVIIVEEQQFSVILVSICLSSSTIITSSCYLLHLALASFYFSRNHFRHTTRLPELSCYYF